MKSRTLLQVSLLALSFLACGQEVKIVVVEPSSISFTKTTQSRKIEAKAQDIRGAEIPGIGFTYHSEDNLVATVDSSGVVKPAGDGNTVIVVETPNKVQGESFIKVCLPKELFCDPADELKLKVGVAGPIKCHLTNCNDKKISARIDFTPRDTTMILKEGDNVFIGLKVGDTSVLAKAYNMEKEIKVHVDEQIYLPGMGPGSVSTGSRGGKGGGPKGDDPYSSGGRFDHILKNMKFAK